MKFFFLSPYMGVSPAIKKRREKILNKYKTRKGAQIVYGTVDTGPKYIEVAAMENREAIVEPSIRKLTDVARRGFNVVLWGVTDDPFIEKLRASKIIPIIGPGELATLALRQTGKRVTIIGQDVGAAACRLWVDRTGLQDVVSNIRAIPQNHEQSVNQYSEGIRLLIEEAKRSVREDDVELIMLGSISLDFFDAYDMIYEQVGIRCVNKLALMIRAAENGMDLGLFAPRGL